MLKEQVISKVIKVEGGLVNDPLDAGGITNFGITKPFMATLLKKPLSAITDADIKNLTPDKASYLYGLYWDICKVGSLPILVQHVYFDMCVNHGQVNAVRILQRAANKAGVSLFIDGRIGPQTVTVLKQFNDGQLLLPAIVSKRNEFYTDIIINKPKQKRFYNGWIKRSNSFLIGA